MKTFPYFCALIFLGLITRAMAADEPYLPGPDSQPQPGVAKGQLIKDTFKESRVFPGTEREYTLYLPAGLDTTKPAPFMVFQDGVIYQAPTVFDNLIAKKELPALIGIFIKPGIVPASNENSLPRFNRSFEYDSITDRYASFLIDEFLPTIMKKHNLNLSRDPDARAIAGSSSGGICAFMVGWHRPDAFRRVFTSVGTYVGIHGADRLPVLVRKYPPKPLRIYLQSGENDNNLYCGDWWLANQMMERSLTWNGYHVTHTWGTGGHNQKHATAIFPDAMRWLWKGYPDEPVKANPRNDAKWRGNEVVGDGEWERVTSLGDFTSKLPDLKKETIPLWANLAANQNGDVFVSESTNGLIVRITAEGHAAVFGPCIPGVGGMAANKDGNLEVCSNPPQNSIHSTPSGRIITLDAGGKKIISVLVCEGNLYDLELTESGERIINGGPTWSGFHGNVALLGPPLLQRLDKDGKFHNHDSGDGHSGRSFCDSRAKIILTPDQTQVYAHSPTTRMVELWQLAPLPDGLINRQPFAQLEDDISPGKFQREHGGGICVDSNGWLYISTTSGVQVCDQCGRVNFIIPAPGPSPDICFGGKDLSELFIICNDTIYKRKTKARGLISGQMAPIKPPAPKL